MRRLIVAGLGLLALVALGLTVAEPLAPRVELDGVTDTIGRGTPMRVVASDRGSGLAHVEVRLVPADGGEPLVLARQDFPRRGLFGSGVRDTTLSPTFGDNLPVPEGRARLEVHAADHSWLSALRRSPRISRDVLVDVTPPTLEVLSKGHQARVGASELAILRAGTDAVTSGIQVGERFFPASTRVFKDPQVHPVLFALPSEAPDARPIAVAIDGAGNRREVPLDIAILPRKFPEKTLAVTEGFLQRKVPELLTANGLASDGSLLDGYLRINRDLRISTENRIGDLCSAASGPPAWSGDDGPLARMPGAALSGFADRRRYVRDGQVVDHQTHLGYDIASTKNAVVPAAAAGRVVFTGPLGIYGDTVILDHGLGLYTLYGHLSEIAVTQGSEVKRTDPIGKTGDTGLAGGDHLHFSTMVRGVHVDPTTWWDRNWVGMHVFGRLADHERVAPAAETEPTS